MEDEITNKVQQNVKSQAIREIPRKFQTKPDTIYLKILPDIHPLSTEEQIFYVRLTEGVFGYNEQVRNDCLKILASDCNVKYLLPYLSVMIRDAIHLNIVCTDLTILIYAVRMTKSLLNNPHFNLDEHLHIILPAILSCCLSKRISKYYYDNHWTLRDFSCFTVAAICRRYSTNGNHMTNRVIGIYRKPLQEFCYSLTSVYGAVKGLACLGEDVMKVHLIPHIVNISKIIFFVLEKSPLNFPSADKFKQYQLEAKQVKELIVNVVAPVLFKIQNFTEDNGTYCKLFGYLGKFLWAEIRSMQKIKMERQMAEMYNRNIQDFKNYTYSLHPSAVILNQNDSPSPDVEKCIQTQD